MKDLSEIEKDQMAQITEAVNDVISETNISDGMAMLALTNIISQVFIANCVGEILEKGLNPRELWHNNAIELTDFFARTMADTLPHIKALVDEHSEKRTVN
jgi:thiamine phosphate synthase YjbQ (UPF0047 family)